MHYPFAVVGERPTQRPRLEAMISFEIDYTFWLNVIVAAMAGVLLWLHLRGGGPAVEAETARPEPTPAGR